MRLLLVLVLMLVLSATGCYGGDGTRVDPMGFVAVGESDAPDGCRVDDVGRLITGFFEAFNSGNIEGDVDRFIAPANRFAWFSVDGVGERFDDEAKDRSTLGSYLQERSDAGERLRLMAMDTEYEQARNVTHIAYIVERTAPEHLEGAKVVVGKGAIDCESGKIMVWSMGTFEGSPQDLCRSAPASTDPALPIVCARQSLEP